VSVHLSGSHPLATVAGRRCRQSHPGRGFLLGGVACGVCWEAAIRADERLAVECELPAAPPPPDREYVDLVAVERAAAGERVPLTRAEKRAAAVRLAAAGYGPGPISVRLAVSGATAALLLGRVAS